MLKYSMVPGGGTRTPTIKDQWILSPLRLPFRHPGAPRVPNSTSGPGLLMLGPAIILVRPIEDGN